MTRRQFATWIGFSLILLPGWQACNNNKVSDVIQSLRDILRSVEKALTALSLLKGLLPDVVNKAAAYLIAVCKFVDQVGLLLESETESDVDKARQILQWAAELTVPAIPPPANTIVAAVAAAVDTFLAYFGTSQPNAVAAARANKLSVPKLTLSDKDKVMLATIHSEALSDKLDVEEWAQKSGGKLTYHVPQVWKYEIAV